MATPAWPPHECRTVSWQASGRRGSRADRELREIEVSVPPAVAGLAVPVPTDLLVELDEATASIVRLDAANADVLSPLAAILLRTESVASSKIERIEASVDDYLRAEVGVRANDTATAMVAGTEAIEHLVGSIARGATLTLRPVLAAHRILVANDPREQPGELRSVQNWIGGSDHSPLDAAYIPPPPEAVPGAMEDLLAFIARDDVPALVQAAVAHAQFESIHPFVDGNGRLGRALVNTVLRRRGTTTAVVVPIASALVAHRDRYFDALTAYRDGDVEPITASFVRSTRVAAGAAHEAALRLRAAVDEMRERVGGVRQGSGVARLLEVLPSTPVVMADDVVNLTGVSAPNAYAAIGRLVDAGVLRPLTERTRNQVWGTALILDELESLGARIQRLAR